MKHYKNLEKVESRLLQIYSSAVLVIRTFLVTLYIGIVAVVFVVFVALLIALYFFLFSLFTFCLWTNKLIISNLSSRC